MADALCGPSNPLQSLRKHTQLDRSLQQDRVVQSRHAAAPTEQFRNHDPRTGMLDGALEAFEHAQPQLDLHDNNGLLGWQQQQQQHHHHHHQLQPQQSAPGAILGGWAADFQRLQISQSPSPVPVSQFRTEAPMVTSTHTGWHNDFLQQQQQQQQSGGMASLKGKEVVAAASSGFGYDFRLQQQQQQQQPLSGLAMPRAGGFIDQQQHQQWENISSDAFEAAFQDVALFEAQAQALEQTRMLEDDQFDLQQQHQQQQPPVVQTKIGSDAIPYTEVKDRTAEQDMQDADELARTAGQLVEMMKGESETNRKFRDSEFLGLMRRLRDREVEVRDNNMVQTGTAPAATVATAVAAISGGNVEQHQEQEQAKSTSETNSNDWAFPDMNDIYAPTNNDLDTASRSYSPVFWDPTKGAASGQEQQQQQQQHQHQTGANDEELDMLLQHQQQPHPLHPGGRWYPEQQQQQQQQGPEVVMSGAVTPLTANDEESASMAQRFSPAHPGQSVPAVRG